MWHRPLERRCITLLESLELQKHLQLISRVTEWSFFPYKWYLVEYRYQQQRAHKPIKSVTELMLINNRRCWCHLNWRKWQSAPDKKQKLLAECFVHRNSMLMKKRAFGECVYFANQDVRVNLVFVFCMVFVVVLLYVLIVGDSRCKLALS